MQIKIYQKNITLTDSQCDYINNKIFHLATHEHRVGDEATEGRVDVEFHDLKTSDRNIVMQITLSVPKSMIRAEVYGKTVEEALDLAVEKLDKQIERYKSRLHRRNKKGEWIPTSTLENIKASSSAEIPADPSPLVKIMKRKVIEKGRPMHEEEAIEQMELLGHEWFAFENLDTGRFSVLYKRHEKGGYGLVEIA